MFTAILKTSTGLTGHELGRNRNETTPSEQQPSTHSSFSFESIIALIFACCGAIISLLNMFSLSLDSVGSAVYQLKDPTINSTLTAISDDSFAHKFFVIPYLSILICLAISALMPFNAFYASQDGKNFIRFLNKVYQKLRYGTPLSNTEKNWLLACTSAADLIFKALATIGIGTTLGMIMLKALNEINNIPNHEDVPDLLAIATIIFVTTFAGKPMANIVTNALQEETGRFANTIKTLFKNLIKPCKKTEILEDKSLIKHTKQPTARTNRAKLTDIVYRALDTAQLSHGKPLSDIESSGDIAEILAKLKSQEVSIVKSLIVEGLMVATFFMSYSGSKFVVELAGSSIQTLLPILNFFSIDIDSFAMKAAAETIGIAGQISFILIWTFLLKNAINRPLMRMFTPTIPFIKLNFKSFGEGFNYSLAYLFGIAVGIAQIPLINIAANDYILQLSCAIASNISFSSAGFNQGRKDDTFLKTIHWPNFFSLNKDIHDKLSEKLSQLLTKLPFMCDENVEKLLDDICKAHKPTTADTFTSELNV